MESSSKRRKLEHSGSGIKHTNLIDFESGSATRLSTASIFTLQTDELLRGAKVDYAKTLKDADEQLYKLKGIIDSIEGHGPEPLGEATSKFEKKHRITVPYPEPRPAKDAPYQLSFEKPAQVNVVGSYVARSMVKTQSRFCVDMIVQMPKTMFQEKDYQNMRYFYRRAYYIAYIASQVRNELGDSMDLSFEFLHDNRLLPVLLITPKAAEENGKSVSQKKKKTGASGHSIRVIPCAPEDLLPTSKLVPSFNSNRGNEKDDKTATRGTPFYNSTLKAEATFVAYLRILTRAKKDCPAFPDACILGRTWLQQRGFGSSISQGGFGHFEWSLLLALLLQTGGRNGQATLSNSLSATEIFKAAVQFLSDTDFNKKPTTLGAFNGTLDAVRETGPVLYDPSTSLNVLFKMHPWSASLLQQYAKSTTDLLSDEAADKFEPIFIVKADILSQIYDATFTINSQDMTKSSGSPDRRGAVSEFSLEAYKVLKKAYGGRAQLLHIHSPTTSKWSLGAYPPPEFDHVTVGVTFQFAQMSRQMEHGPPAEEQKEAARFRQFWGEKAELRRFKDGSILECVEWQSRLPFQVCEEIARYILARHLKLTQEEVSFHGPGLHSVLEFSNMDKDAFDSARKAFQTFEHDIRTLEDLPLQIRQLSQVSSYARYSSLYPPMLGFHTGSIQPMEVNMHFEASNKWPENLIAIQEAKIEFLLDIDRRLTGAHENITTYLGRENRDVGVENLAYLDVVYENGAAFRVRVHCDLEEVLLGRQVMNKTLDHYIRDEAEETLASVNWQYSTLALHTQMIATFCTRFHALSQSIRLVKEWFNAHKLMGHISEEVIELLVLHVFLTPYPWKMPSSASTGFLRTLDFLARWNWKEEPLIVDSAESLTTDERSAIYKNLETWRKRDPNMNNVVLFIATSHDHSGRAYTRHNPSKLIASRMTRLAQAACKLVKEKDHRLDPAQLFETSLSDYDVLFHLSPKAVKSILREAAAEPGVRKQSQFKNLDDRTGKVPLPIRAHPIEVLLEELQRVYDDTLIFFRAGVEGIADEDSDHIIGAIWNPRLQQQKFRAGLPYNIRKVSDAEGDVVEVNRQAVLLEIARIGGEMIKKIEELEEDD
uniref:U3 small nucleolar RNA-associated protein 22 n=1 Tax=Bionectria ochroleuca TaxID=29856 RepID=A0A8H7NIY7_BIOOC